MRYTMLGSGAVRDNPRRGGPSQLLELCGENWMFDCGRSACTRLAQAGVACEAIDRLFLTHLHFDHIVDVAYLVFVGWVKVRKKPLFIYGPVGTRHFVEHLIRPPFEQDIQSRISHGKDDTVLDPIVIEIPDAGEVFSENGVKVSAVFVDHGGIPTLVYRMDTDKHRVVITGDGNPDEHFATFCEGADLLSIECSGTAEFLARQPWGSWHISPPEIADIASRAGVKRVLIKHLVIEDITGDLTAAQKMGDQIRSGYPGEVIVGSDGLTVDL
ncbi:MAG: MBL fold metallo-hydrolase [bacterium]|nr:MBL fold metallo-hydrolase [bacterium]